MQMTVEQIQALQARISKYTVPDEVMEYQRRAEEINRTTANLVAPFRANTSRI